MSTNTLKYPQMYFYQWKSLMIHVLATVLVKKGCLSDALNCYRYLVPLVLEKESGCIEYSPTLDYSLGISNQSINPDRILVTERWRSEQDFRAHLAMPHCEEFRTRIQPYLAEGITVEVTCAALMLP